MGDLIELLPPRDILTIHELVERYRIAEMTVRAALDEMIACTDEIGSRDIVEAVDNSTLDEPA